MYSSGGECCWASTNSGGAEACPRVSVTLGYSIAVTVGLWSEICCAGSMLGNCADNMSLQHPWLRFAGMQGIERQHCMAVWFIPMAGVQAPNCSSKRAAAANAKNSRFLIAPTLGRLDLGVKNSDCLEEPLDTISWASRA